MKCVNYIVTIIFTLALTCAGGAFADTRTSQQAEIKRLDERVSSLDAKIEAATSSQRRSDRRTQNRLTELGEKIEATDSACTAIETAFTAADTELRTGLASNADHTNYVETTGRKRLSTAVWWSGGVIFFLSVAACAAIWALKRRLHSGFQDIQSVRKAQEELQRQSMKLDTQLLELLNRKLGTAPQTSIVPDHTLPRKVADELTRIEVNLSRMDPSIKGYKQLSRAVGRIKENFLANGYEIDTLMGRDYNEHMNIDVDFVDDPTLEDGRQVITHTYTPQILYNGKIIQKASVKVSQNI